MKPKSPAEVLREMYVATRISFKWWGQRRQVEKGTRQRMAEAVDAESESITAGKKLYDTAIPAIADINALKNEIKEQWESETLPYSVEGIRLLPKANAGEFDQRMREFADRLRVRAAAVQSVREAILNDARNRLGSSFCAGNYPLDLSTLYTVEWSFPSLQPADDLPPQVYEQQKQYAAAKLQEAVQLAETAFLSQFKELVDHLHDKLSPAQDGSKKIFRDTAVTNLTEFFSRFKQLSLGSNADLEALVSEAEELVSGLDPDDLRKGKLLRTEVASGLAQIAGKLDPLVTNKPRRRIVTPNQRGTNDSGDLQPSADGPAAKAS